MVQSSSLQSGATDSHNNRTTTRGSAQGCHSQRQRDRTLPGVWNVILGAAIALAGTFVVQVWLIPWVGRRSRALEGWELDVLELGSLLSREIAIARQDA